MRVLVVYESMYGNTHKIAESIASGFPSTSDTEVVSAAEARHHNSTQYDLVVVGGPTHAHGLSRRATRESAVERAAKDASREVEPSAAGIGIREWLEGLGLTHGEAAAFDTRIKAAPLLTGRASKAIASMLRQHGYHLVADPMSFLVTTKDELVVGEDQRAKMWGASLARVAAGGTDQRI